MKKGLAILSISILSILLIWGLCFYNPVTILLNGENWLLGKSFNGFIIFSISGLIFLFSILVYIITGGERHIGKKEDHIQTALSHEKGLMDASINLFSSKEEELEFLKYKSQLDGPSIFKSKNWSTSLELPINTLKEDPDPCKFNTVLDHKPEYFKGNDLLSQNSDKSIMNPLGTYLQLDLENISEGLVEIPNPGSKNSLERNIDELLFEQDKILEPIDTKDTIPSQPSSVTTNSSSNKSLLKVVHNSTR